MAESANRPVAAKLYQSPADSGAKAQSGYSPPGRPAAREPEATLGVRRNSQAHTMEPAQPPPTAVQSTHRVGDTVEHAKSGQRGTVVGHRAHGYGEAVPEVQWAGEEKSWPQGVSANALRVVGSTPSDLYTYNQDATSGRPMRGSTGAR